MQYIKYSCIYLTTQIEAVYGFLETEKEPKGIDTLSAYPYLQSP